MDLAQFIEQKLNGYAEKTKLGTAKMDELALGELTFYMALRRVTAGKGTPTDVGMMDASNDTLQNKGIIKPGTTFLR